MRSGLFRVFLTANMLVLVCAAVALGATTPGPESTPIPQAPKPDFSSMKFMLGTWHCINRSSRRPTSFTTTTVTTLDPTGYWMIVKSATPQLSWSSPINSTDSITYDPVFRRWADVYTDDQGGYGVTYSPGWKDDTITWTDALFTPGPAIVSTSPTVTTKDSASKTSSHSTFQEKSGRSVTYDVVCTKG